MSLVYNIIRLRMYRFLILIYTKLKIFYVLIYEVFILNYNLILIGPYVLSEDMTNK